MPGQLFTHYFLTDGIKTTPEWESSEGTAEDFNAKLGQLYKNFTKYHPLINDN